MRRTMESVAAERLTKIGKNPSIVSSRADLEEDQKLVNEIVMESTPIPTSASEDEDRDSDDSSDGSKHKKKSSFKFDFATKLHKISEERKHKPKETVRDRGAEEFDETKHQHGHSWTKLPKVYSGSNLFGLKVPSLPERKRSGSVGDTFSLASTRLTQSLDEADEDESHDHDNKRRGSFLSGRIMKAFELKDLKPKHLKDNRRSHLMSSRERKKSSTGDSKHHPDTAQILEESASLLTPCQSKDSKDTANNDGDVKKDLSSHEPQSKLLAKTDGSGKDTKPPSGHGPLKSSLKSSNAASADEPAKIPAVECSEVGSTLASTGSDSKDETSPKGDETDTKSKEVKQKELAPKVVFFTDPIVQAYGKSKSNTS